MSSYLFGARRQLSQMTLAARLTETSTPRRNWRLGWPRCGRTESHLPQFPAKRSLDVVGHRRESNGDASRSSRPEGEDIVPAHKASPVQLSAEHERELNDLVRAHSTPQKLAERARIILLAAAGLGVEETAQRLGIWRKTASHWRRRWRDAEASAGVAARLSDAPRCGAPATFTPEVICQIMALSCEDPETLDVPISHWSQSELARQSVARGIVKSISHGSVGRFLKRGRSQAASQPLLADTEARSRASTRSVPTSARCIRRRPPSPNRACRPFRSTR